MTAAISLEAVVKRYGGAAAVNEVTLSIGEGEFFSLLGPSGCGKTTTLRMIAGFVAPDAGRVLLQGTDVTNTPPNRRNVNMVFQQYALFPHMSVYDNIAFGLSVKRVPREERDPRISEMLKPLATAVIGGILASMVLSLIVTPAVHYYLSPHGKESTPA